MILLFNYKALWGKNIAFFIFEISLKLFYELKFHWNDKVYW